MRPVVLVIAGSDSSGGAGLLRDVQVLTRLEVEARCVVTAVTAQTHTSVSAIHHVPPEIVREQMRAALETGDIGAIKIGMLGALETIKAVIEALPSRDHIPIVLDPVLSSSSGSSLLTPSAQTGLKDLLLPRVTLVTPNLPEAARLLAENAATDDGQMIEQAQRILGFGSQAVLLKGGHALGQEAVDVLVTASDTPVRLRAARVDGALRGTGCALSSAIAANLALQMPLVVACERAKAHVWSLLQQAAQ
jgi:hydroxymethylpyrimidine/phosphomethylpyrimidine kinase